MNTSYDVKIWDLRRKVSGKTPSYVVRWKAGPREKSKTFKTKALAENFLSDLRQAVKKGEPFDFATGLPQSMTAAEVASGPTFLDFARSYMAARWVHSAARTRETMTYALLSLVPALVKDLPNKPDDEDLRAVLREYAFLPDKRRGELRSEHKAAFGWVEEASLPLVDLLEPAVIRSALDAIALRFDGDPAAANTVRRKRAVLHHIMESAVELKKLSANPLHAVKWKPPKATGTVDPRTVVNPDQVRALLDAVKQVGWTRGSRMMAMFACMYYAALRPEEASGLCRQNCDLPVQGWGLVTLERARPQANKRWTNSGKPTTNAVSSTGPRTTLGRSRFLPSSSRSSGSTLRNTELRRTAGSFARAKVGLSPPRRTRPSGRKPEGWRSPSNRLLLPWRLARTTFGTPRFPSG